MHGLSWESFENKPPSLPPPLRTPPVQQAPETPLNVEAP